MVPCEETRSGDKNGKVQKVRRSEVQLYGASPSSCGYCPGTAESSLSYGVVSQSMSAEDYETLMLIGWRRSGALSLFLLNCLLRSHLSVTYLYL